MAHRKTTLYCGHCQTPVKSYHTGYFEPCELGEPIRKCPGCGQPVRLCYTHEWEHMDALNKGMQYLYATVSVGALGAVAMLVAGALVYHAVTKYLGAWEGTTTALFVVGAIAETAIVWLSHRNLCRRIEQSRARMADPQYRQLLAGMGIGPPQIDPLPNHGTASRL